MHKTEIIGAGVSLTVTNSMEQSPS